MESESEIFTEKWYFSILIEGEYPEERSLKRRICDYIFEKNAFDQKGRDSEGEYNDCIFKKIQKIVLQRFDVPEYGVSIIDYTEKEGSLIIVEFSLLAILYGGFIGYRSFRQALDYFKYDLQHFFDLLSREINIGFSIKREMIERRHSLNKDADLYTVKDRKEPQETYSFERRSARNNGSQKDNVSFSFREIILAITFINLVLFFGGTIWSGVRINSIEDKYNRAVEIVNTAQRELSSAETTLIKLKREASNAEYEIKRIIESHINKIGNTNLREIEALTQQILGDLQRSKNKVESLQKEGEKVNEILVKINDLKDKSIVIIDQSSKVVSELNDAKDQLYKNKNIVLTGLISSIWNNGDIYVKVAVILYLLFPLIIIVYLLRDIVRVVLQSIR